MFGTDRRMKKVLGMAGTVALILALGLSPSLAAQKGSGTSNPKVDCSAKLASCLSGCGKDASGLCKPGCQASKVMCDLANPAMMQTGGHSTMMHSSATSNH